MNAGGEFLFGGDPAEQRDELLAFAGVEAHAELGLMFGRRIHDFAEHAAALAGEVQGADAAVPGNGPPLEQAALLEPIDERNHAAGRDLQRLRQRVLRLPLRRADVSKQHHFARIKAETLHPFPPEARRVEADLGEQERRTGYAQALSGAVSRRLWISHAQNRTSTDRFMIVIITEMKLFRSEVRNRRQ
jgi:hypothetical protein